MQYTLESNVGLKFVDDPFWLKETMPAFVKEGRFPTEEVEHPKTFPLCPVEDERVMVVATIWRDDSDPAGVIRSRYPYQCSVAFANHVIEAGGKALDAFGQLKKKARKRHIHTTRRRWRFQRGLKGMTLQAVCWITKPDDSADRFAPTDIIFEFGADFDTPRENNLVCSMVQGLQRVAVSDGQPLQ